ncbi:hypothetical protein ACB094_06G238400 [Castanea mollissima]
MVPITTLLLLKSLCIILNVRLPSYHHLQQWYNQECKSNIICHCTKNVCLFV